MIKDKNAARKRQARESIKPDDRKLLTSIVERWIALEKPNGHHVPVQRIVYFLGEAHKRKPLQLKEWLAMEDREFLRFYGGVMS